VAKELKIWMNGRLVSQAEAVLPVNSAAVFYATNGSPSTSRASASP